MKRKPKISIIIPIYRVTPELYQAVDQCLALDYPNYEILLVLDKGTKFPVVDKKIKYIRTNQNQTGPAEKRDIALKKARGKYVAFLDDDSYPESDWLTKAVEIMRSEGVEVVCGPGLTPPNNGMSQKLTGAILGSYLGSGPFYYRFVKAKPRYVDDYPAYNLIVSKKILDEVEGFGTTFYGGEDTALCLKIINCGHKIYYHPDIPVYHHRRAFPQGYFRQVGNVGKHRGFFVKKYPQTSFRPIYFMPMILSLAIIISFVLMLFSPQLIPLFLALFLLYVGIVILENAHRLQIHIILSLPFAILLAHMAYGYQFTKGLFFTRELKR